MLVLAVCLRTLAAEKVSARRVMSTQFEHKMISSGRNYPSVRLESAHLGDICILLHYGVSLEQIRSFFQWTREELNQRIAELQGEELIRPAAVSYRPTITIINEKEAHHEFAVPRSLITKSADAIQSILPSVRVRYTEIRAFQSIPFQRTSLLILSDVLLDNWQIRNVEQSLFTAPRTPRAGKNYYYAAMQRSPGRESFGIYGNSNTGLGGIAIGLYGNTRERLNLVTASSSQLTEMFGLPVNADPWAFKKELALELANVRTGRDALMQQHVRGLEMLGLVHNGVVQIPILSKTDDDALTAIAQMLTPKLVALLDEYRIDLERRYRQSAYANEITFQEFFVWWYHFFYTAVTNELVARGSIQIPATGTVTYLMM